MCSVIVWMSSVLIYNVENKQKPLNEKLCPNFSVVLYIFGLECLRCAKKEERKKKMKLKLAM